MATTTDGPPVALPGSDDGLPPVPPTHYRGPEHAAWKPPLGPVRKTVREIGWDMITAGLVVLLFVAYQLYGTGFAEAASQARLKKQFAGPTAAATPATHSPPGGGDAPTVGGASGPALPGPPEGAAVAHMKIDRINLDVYIVQGVAEADLSQGPGHYPNTPMPGQPGNAAIAGHRTTYGAPFFHLNELQAGDDIYVTTNAGQFLYVVDHSEVVKPTDVGVLNPTTDNQLTLTTCNPPYSATSRLIVVAKLASLPVTPPPTIPVVIKANLGTGDHSAWPEALAFGAVVLALWLGVRLWARHRRYWKWIPFLVGIPVCAVPLWFLFQTVVKLLPNNL